MMQNLVIEEGGDVTIESVKLPKGTFAKIQPHETAFIDLPNPRAVLENTLRNYSCLSQGETICVQFNNRNYDLDIIETRPHTAILTVETDLNVDFDAPKDYKEIAPAQAM